MSTEGEDKANKGTSGKKPVTVQPAGGNTPTKAKSKIDNLKGRSKPFVKNDPRINLKGAPKRKWLTDLLIAELNRDMPAGYIQSLNEKGAHLGKSAKWVKLAIRGIIKRVGAGDAAMADLLFNRVEGLLRQEISGPDGGPIPLTDVPFDKSGYARATEVTKRIRQRVAARESGNAVSE